MITLDYLHCFSWFPGTNLFITQAFINITRVTPASFVSQLATDLNRGPWSAIISYYLTLESNNGSKALPWIWFVKLTFQTGVYVNKSMLMLLPQRAIITVQPSSLLLLVITYGTSNNSAACCKPNFLSALVLCFRNPQRRWAMSRHLP